MANPNPTHEQTKNKTDSRTFFEKGLHWPLGLLLMFLLSASFLLTTAVFGAGKGSRAVEPDYYTRSLNWDDEKSRLQTADRLGWDVQLSTSPTIDPLGTRLISIMIHDAQGNPIQDALVELTCFSQSNADKPLTKILPSTGPGHYQDRIQAMHTPGLWEYRISIRHAGEQALIILANELED